MQGTSSSSSPSGTASALFAFAFARVMSFGLRLELEGFFLSKLKANIFSNRNEMSAERDFSFITEPLGIVSH